LETNLGGLFATGENCEKGNGILYFCPYRWGKKPSAEGKAEQVSKKPARARK